MINQDSIRIKAEILCWGIRTSKTAEKIYLLQHPTLHKRTGNAGLHLIMKGGLVINVIYGELFCEKSPYSLEDINKTPWIFKNNKPVCQCSVIPTPKWYRRLTSDNVLMSSILLQEGKDTLTAAIWNNCAYFSKNLQCRYCILGYDKGVEFKKVSQVIETTKAALKENPNYYLHFTGGNTFSPDHGIAYYEEYVKAARKINKITPISLELSPPDDISWIDKIIEAGANGFSINIEVWDEQKRKKICPGKSRIKRDLYFKAWQKGVDLVGKFKTSSVMIVGLDTKKSIMDGIKTMVDIGVKPVLIPLRPFTKSLLNHLPPPEPDELMELSILAGKEMKKNKAFSNNFVGCEHCGACTVEKDCLDFI